MLDRRLFLGQSLGLAACTLSGWSPRAWGDASQSGTLRFGLITDVHQDVMHDGVDRIRQFVAAMTERRVDFIMQLGDFCVPHQRNEGFLAAWNKFAGPKYHVLGNHDTDGDYKREKAAEFYGMPARYYSFDQGGLHFIVLDGNDPDGKTKGYPRSVNAEQLKWLAGDLAKTALPTIIAMHQPMDSYDKSAHITNAAQVRAVLKDANDKAGFQKVLAVFSGHAHLDYQKATDGIAHLQINSASYAWVGKKHASYDAAILKKHPSMASICGYEEPLWAIVEVDFERGELRCEGRQTKWHGQDPWQVGLKEDDYQYSRELSRPAISDRQVKLATKQS